MIDPTKVDKDKVRAHLGGLLRELEAEKLQPAFTVSPTGRFISHKIVPPELPKSK